MSVSHPFTENLRMSVHLWTDEEGIAYKAIK